MEVSERPDRVLHEGLFHLDYDHWDYDHGNLDLLAFDLHHLLSVTTFDSNDETSR